MKIAILISSLKRGGAERVASSLANEFVSRGDLVAIYKLDAEKPSYRLAESITCENVVSRKENIVNRILERMQILKHKINEFKPDVVLCFSLQIASYVLLERKRKFVTIASERSNPFYVMKYETSFLKKFFCHLLNNFLMPHADGFVFLTKEAALYYNKRIRAKSTVIPNALFAEDVPSSPVKFAERNHYKICAVANLRKVKDYDTMLRAFAEFHKTHPQHTLHILGEGKERGHLESLINMLCIADAVNMHGAVPNPVDYIKDAGMFLATSRSESWSNSILEALACGIPCVCTDCDFGPRAMITSEYNGLLVPVGDSHSLCKAMIRVADDSRLAERISNNALQVRENFNKDKIVNMYYKFFIECSNRKLSKR